MRIVYANCRSLVPNLESLRAHASSCKSEVIALSETWLDDSITDCEIFIPDYFMIRRERNHCGGGVLLYINERIPTASILCHPTLELLFVEFTLKHGPLSIGLYYHPLSSIHSLTEFEQFLGSLNPNKLKYPVFLGDLSITFCPKLPSHWTSC